MLELPGKPPAWRRYLRFWRGDPTADLDAELQFHVESRVDELVSDGLSRDDAIARALVEFGDLHDVRAKTSRIDAMTDRRRGIAEWMGDIFFDLRYAGRSLRRSPAFAAVVTVTLALGIGLNSTIFSLVNAYLFRPADLPDSRRIVVIGQTRPALRQPHEVPYRDMQAYRELRHVFVDLTGTISYTESLDEQDRTERIWVERTTGNYFTLLRAPIAIGREYTTAEGERNEPVIVLSHNFWTRRFSADSSIIGRTIRVSGEPRLVVGIAAPTFRGFAPMIASDGWIPIDETPAARSRLMDRADGVWFSVYGRLREGVTLAQARGALEQRAALLERQYPATNRDVDPVIVPETRARPVLAVAAPVPAAAAMLLGLTLLVLAVACANVASLLLARGASRRRELAVRAALGAGRWRLTRQALVEVLLLALLGALAALALARWSTARLATIDIAVDVPLFFDYSPDWRVFAFTFAAGLAATVVAGLVPALRVAGVSPQVALAAGGRSFTDRAQQRVRSLIVVGQIAVSVVVLVAAGLLTRSMQAAQTMDPGFRTKNLLLAQFDLSLSGYDSSRSRAFQENLLERVRALPGVTGAALSARIPFGYSNNALRVATDARTNPDDAELIFTNVVSPDHFRIAGPEIVRGREFTTADNGAAQMVTVVNEAMAERLWPGADALGRIVRLREPARELRVVGVARTAQYMILGETGRPFFWLPIAQHPRSNAFVEIATAGAPESLIQAVRNVARELDANVPLFEVRSMEEHLRNGRALLAIRMGAALGGIFAFLALALAGVGLYGLVSYAVGQRTREIGIRLAIGASLRSVVALVLKQGVRLSFAGMLVGLALALAVSRLMSALLYDVRAVDPMTFVGSALVLAAVAVLASWLPARRAASMDPVRALREE